MSLNDLEKYIEEQEGAIARLPQEFISQSTRSKYWKVFRDLLWGKGLESSQELEDVQRGSNPVEIVAVPEKHTVASFPIDLPDPWGESTHIPYTDADMDIAKDAEKNVRKILVRSEYEEAERAAVSSSKEHDVFVVCGQPGIGKSVFLAWLLMRRLTLKLPTVLQINPDSAVLFHEGGVFELANLRDSFLYRNLSAFSNRWTRRERRIWAIVDLGPQLQEPTPIFKSHSPFFVVNGMSPRSKQEWQQKLHRLRFFMKPWSISEILQARPFLSNNPTEHQLWDLYQTFRPSPRVMIMHARRPADYMKKVREAVDKTPPEALKQAVRDPESSDFSHIIITIFPSPADRDSFEVDFASLAVFQLVWDKYLHSRIDDMAYYYDLFSASKISATAAGWIFEFRMHQVLRSGGTIQLFPILSSGKGDANLIYNNHTASRHRKDLKTLESLPSAEYPLTTATHLEENCYYRPEAKNFPTIDSLLIVHPDGEPLPILLMFQITRSGHHDAKIGGLRKVDNLHLPAPIKKYYVVVTPENAYPQITVPIRYFVEDRGVSVDVGRSADEEFPVFQYLVRLENLFQNQ